MKILKKNKYIEALFEGSFIRNLYEDELPPARYTMVLKSSDLLTEEEKQSDTKDFIAKERVGQLVEALRQESVNPEVEVCYELSLDETAMSNPEIKNIISQHLDKYKKEQGEQNEIEIG